MEDKNSLSLSLFLCVCVCVFCDCGGNFRGNSWRLCLYFVIAERAINEIILSLPEQLSFMEYMLFNRVLNLIE